MVVSYGYLCEWVAKSAFLETTLRLYYALLKPSSLQHKEISSIMFNVYHLVLWPKSQYAAFSS
jgi:hypothetical protein